MPSMRGAFMRSDARYRDRGSLARFWTDGTPVVGACALALTGAVTACSDDKPYVPFTVGGSSVASSEPAPLTSSSAAPLPTFAVVTGTAPPGDPKTFPLGSGNVQTRTGRVFRKGLAFDADSDQVEDLFAWTAASDASKGELVYFRGGDTPAETVLAKLPVALDIGECSHDAVLERIGHGVVVVRVGASCGDAQAKQRWIAVARIDRSGDIASRRPPEMRLVAHAKAPLDLEIAAADRDADQLEDVVLTVSLADGAETDPPSASLVLWDRPAGYAWDPAEPEASLGTLGKALLARAVAKKADAEARAEDALRFVRALCSDLGGGKLTTSAGDPQCQKSRVIGDALHTIGYAASSSGDISKAVAAAEAVSNLKFDFGRVPQIEGLYAKKVKKVDATVSRRASAKPGRRTGLLSPLMFDGTGGLLVAGEVEVVRVDLTSGEETVSDATPWSRTVSWVSGDATVELASASRQCSPRAITLTAGGRGSPHPVDLSVMSSLVPSSVTKDAYDKGTVDVSTILIDNAGAVFAVEGQIFRGGFGDQGVTFSPAQMPAPSAPASPPGSARSLDGKSTVLPLGKSLLVYKGPAIERWRGPDTEGLQQCVVSSEGDHVACLQKGTVVVLSPKGK